jgi:hypothetical protein
LAFTAATVLVVISRASINGETLNKHLQGPTQALCLKEAEVADLESALNYGSHQPDMARFYTGKANETHALLVRLQEGKSACAQEIAQALDVSGAEEISRPQFESSYD